MTPIGLVVGTANQILLVSIHPLDWLVATTSMLHWNEYVRFLGRHVNH